MKKDKWILTYMYAKYKHNTDSWMKCLWGSLYQREGGKKCLVVDDQYTRQKYAIFAFFVEYLVLMQCIHLRESKNPKTDEVFKVYLSLLCNLLQKWSKIIGIQMGVGRVYADSMRYSVRTLDITTSDYRSVSKNVSFPCEPSENEIYLKMIDVGYDILGMLLLHVDQAPVGNKQKWMHQISIVIQEYLVRNVLKSDIAYSDTDFQYREIPTR